MFLHFGAFSSIFVNFVKTNAARSTTSKRVLSIVASGIAGEAQTEVADFFRELQARIKQRVADCFREGQEVLLFQSRRMVLAYGQNRAAESDRPAVISIGKEEALERMRRAA